MNRIEINVQTGEQVVVPLTQEEVADAEARTAAELPAAPVSPIDKLRAFLDANPDVKEAIDG